MINASFDFSKINARLDKITQAAKEAVRPAAQAGAQVFYDEVRERAPVGDQAEHLFYGDAAKKAPKGRKKAQAYLLKRGGLKDAIYQYRLRYYDDGGRSTYAVSWNHKEAPHGYMIEFGTSRASARPFLRPAYDAVRDKAIGAVKKTMAISIKRAIQQ